MRKALFTPLILLILACSEDEPKLVQSDDPSVQSTVINKEDDIIQKSYEFNNREYFVDFILQGSSAEPIEGEKDYAFIKALLDKPETAVYFNLKTSKRMIFENEDKLEAYLKKKRIDMPDIEKKEHTRQQMRAPLTVFKDAHYGGESTNIYSSIPDLGTIGFHDNISSLQTAALPIGSQIILHENHNFSGKKIIIEPRGYNVDLVCLCDFKIGSSGPNIIYIPGDGGVDPGGVCGWFCNSWNDETSSISFNYL